MTRIVLAEVVCNPDAGCGMKILQCIWASPKLPSGRHVAIDCSPLREVINEADASGDVEDLLRIWHGKELRQYLSIVEIEERPDLPQSELAVAEIKPQQHVRFMTADTGYSLEEVLGGNAPWSAEDIDEFREFVDEIWVVARLALCIMQMRDALATILSRSPGGHLRNIGSLSL